MTNNKAKTIGIKRGGGQSLPIVSPLLFYWREIVGEPNSNPLDAIKC